MTQLDFEVAGVPLRVCGVPPSHLVGRYSEAPAAGPPALVLEIELVPGFAEGRETAPEYPAFTRRVIGPRRLLVERYDADGEVDLAAGPVRAHFRVAPQVNSVEAVIRIAASLTLPRFGVLLMHTSSAEIDGGAHLFAGRSGAGKSTIASLLADAGCTRLTDELTAVRRSADDWSLHVPPFLAAPGLPVGATRPLAAVHSLVQAPDHRRTALAAAVAFPELLRHVLTYATETADAGLVLDHVAHLVRTVPCHRLEFAKRADIAEVLSGP